MSLGLLAPLFLAGLVAVAIPILVHLVRRDERTSFAFPSLMFLKAIPVREHRRRTIRHWWLLALRCLIVALLCFAFAKPFIERANNSVGSSNDNRDRVIVLDRSLSMQSASRWKDAVRKAQEAIDTLDTGDRGALLLFDYETLLAQELTADHALLRQALSASEAGDGNTDLIGAIARGGALLENSNAARREIVLISDFQRSAVESGERGRRAPGVDFVARAVTTGSEVNASVAAVTLARKALGTGDAVELTARLVNTGSLPVQDTELVMEVDGQERERRILSLAPGESRDAVFRLVLAADELLRVRIYLGDDALPADNSFYLLVNGPTAIATLLVEDRGAAPNKALHLRQALGQGDNPGFRIDSRLVSQLRASDIENADVIVIDDAPIPGGSLGDDLHRFLQSGGGLLIAAGGRAQGTWPGGEQGIVPGQLGPPIGRAGSQVGRLARMNSLHPALAAFADADSGDLSAAQVFRYRRLTGVADSAVLASYDDGNVAVAEHTVGRGRVLVMTTTLGPSWNTLALQPGYLPFVHEMLKYLASHVPTTNSVAVGETLDLESYARGLPGYTRVAAALSRGTITTVRAPSGRQIHLAPGEAFVKAREAGFYEVHVSGGGGRSLVFAANPLPRESDLAPLDLQSFNTGFEIVDGKGATEQEIEARGVDTAMDQRAWWFLLLAGVLLLALDTLFSNRLSRSPARS
jgi:hypothetical protein